MLRGSHSIDLQYGRLRPRGDQRALQAQEPALEVAQQSLPGKTAARLLPAYRGRTLVARGYRLLRELHRDGRTDLYYTVIAAENTPALRTLAAGRAGLPAYAQYISSCQEAEHWRERVVEIWVKTPR